MSSLSVQSALINSAPTHSTPSLAYCYNRVEHCFPIYPLFPYTPHKNPIHELPYFALWLPTAKCGPKLYSTGSNQQALNKLCKLYNNFVRRYAPIQIKSRSANVHLRKRAWRGRSSFQLLQSMLNLRHEVSVAAFAPPNFGVVFLLCQCAVRTSIRHMNWTAWDTTSTFPLAGRRRRSNQQSVPIYRIGVTIHWIFEAWKYLSVRWGGSVLHHWRHEHYEIDLAAHDGKCFAQRVEEFWPAGILLRKPGS